MDTLCDTLLIYTITKDSIEIDSITSEPERVTARILTHKGDTMQLEVSLDPVGITEELGDNNRFIGVVRFYSHLKERKIIIPVFARIKKESDE
jgi:hypothetical protein